MGLRRSPRGGSKDFAFPAWVAAEGDRRESNLWGVLSGDPDPGGGFLSEPPCGMGNTGVCGLGRTAPLGCQLLPNSRECQPPEEALPLELMCVRMEAPPSSEPPVCENSCAGERLETAALYMRLWPWCHRLRPGTGGEEGPCRRVPSLCRPRTTCQPRRQG